MLDVHRCARTDSSDNSNLHMDGWEAIRTWSNDRRRRWRTTRNRTTDAHVTRTDLAGRQWLPIRYGIIYKLCLMIHNAHVGRSPRYITKMLTAAAHLPNRNRLRPSASTRYEPSPSSQDRRTRFLVLWTCILEQSAE